MNDNKTFCIVTALVTLIIIAVVITIFSTSVYTKVKAFQYGYEQVTVPGYSMPVWKKIHGVKKGHTK